MLLRRGSRDIALTCLHAAMECDEARHMFPSLSMHILTPYTALFVGGGGGRVRFRVRMRVCVCVCVFVRARAQNRQCEDGSSIIPWSPPARQTVQDATKKQEFDILVIGGGATGSGVALDAATRGLKVALVEQVRRMSSPRAALRVAARARGVERRKKCWLVPPSLHTCYRTRRGGERAPCGCWWW